MEALLDFAEFIGDAVSLAALPTDTNVVAEAAVLLPENIETPAFPESEEPSKLSIVTESARETEINAAVGAKPDGEKAEASGNDEEASSNKRKSPGPNSDADAEKKSLDDAPKKKDRKEKSADSRPSTSRAENPDDEDAEDLLDDGTVVRLIDWLIDRL